MVYRITYVWIFIIRIAEEKKIYHMGKNLTEVIAYKQSRTIRVCDASA